MTDFEFFAFWGSCLGFMLLFSAFISVLELVQRKRDRQAQIEADEHRRVYELKQAYKKRWEQNMAESEKLFEGVENVK